MRLVGETQASLMGPAKQIRTEGYTTRNIAVLCYDCGYEQKESAHNLSKYHTPDKFLCFNCRKAKREKDREDITAAIVGLYRRKQPK